MPPNAHSSSCQDSSEHGVAAVEEEEDSRKQRRKWKNQNKKEARMQKYLRPGALAQLRDARINKTGAYCPAIGRKRILVMDVDGPLKSNSPPTTTAEEGDELLPRNKKAVLATPKTPKTASQHPEVESRLESLPIDLLVRILCLLHHDELKSVFHVSQRIRKVAVMARQCYFNYITPDRSRQDMLKLTTGRLDEQWPSLGGAGNGGVMPYPTAPKAPRHNHRPPIRLSVAEMRQVSASLFQGSSFTDQCRKPKPPGLHRLAFRSQPSSRVLFYEKELCEAVAQNTIR